jgi:DNA modification methylase
MGLFLGIILISMMCGLEWGVHHHEWFLVSLFGASIFCAIMAVITDYWHDQDEKLKNEEFWRKIRERSERSRRSKRQRF